MKALLGIFLAGALDYDPETTELVVLDPIERILRHGQETGEFRDFDPWVVAASVRRSVDGIPMLLKPPRARPGRVRHRAVHPVRPGTARTVEGGDMTEQKSPRRAGDVRAGHRVGHRRADRHVLPVARPGVSTFLALLLSAVLPGLTSIYQVIRSGRLTDSPCSWCP